MLTDTTETVTEEMRKVFHQHFDDWHDWDDYLREEWKLKFEAMGFWEPEIILDLGFSQGDHAHVLGSVNVMEFIKYHKWGNDYRYYRHLVNTDWADTHLKISEYGRNWYYMDFEISVPWHYKFKTERQRIMFCDDIERIEQDITDTIKNYNSEMYIQFYNAYWDFISDDNILMWWKDTHE